MAETSSLLSPVQIDIAMEEPLWDMEFPDVEVQIRKAVDSSCAVLIKKMNQVFHDTEISVLLSNNDVIQHLNKTYRDKDKPTNILSFPMDNDMPDIAALSGEAQPRCLGDLALALAVILDECEQQNKAKNDHFIHLIIHGFLHLLGFDHETDNEAEEMESLEIEILARMGIKNPYETA